MRFELSLDKGKSVAIIEGGTNDGDIVHVYDVDSAGSSAGRTKASKEMDLLCENFFSRIKGRLNFVKVDRLHRALKNRERPDDQELQGLYDEALELLEGSVGKEILLARNDGKMQQIWDINEERQVFYIAGMSGSGKSYFAGELVDIYQKLYPDREVFLFSNKPEDPSFDSRDIQRVPLDESMFENQLELSDIHDSLIIFDDIEAVKSKDVQEELARISEMVLQQGRSSHISMIYIAHLANDYKKSRVILNECHAITIFPQFATVYGLKYLFQKYFGLDKNDINRIIDLPSRWVTVFKIPLTVLHENGVYLLK
jgi:hypothetical protein